MGESEYVSQPREITPAILKIVLRNSNQEEFLDKLATRHTQLANAANGDLASSIFLSGWSIMRWWNLQKLADSEFESPLVREIASEIFPDLAFIDTEYPYAMKEFVAAESKALRGRLLDDVFREKQIIERREIGSRFSIIGRKGGGEG